MSETNLGYIEVHLYAGLAGAEPIDVGTVRLPLTLRSVSSGTIEAHLTEALEYVGEDLRHVFGSQSSSAGDPA